MAQTHSEQTPTLPDPGRIIDRVILALLILGLVAFAIHHLVAYDFWWQLKTGQLIRGSGFPTTDPFSYGFPGGVWIEVRWLYCVVVSLIYDGLGPQVLIAAKVPFLLIGAVSLWLLGRKGPSWAVNLGLLVVLMLMHQRFTIRPELVTYVIFAVSLLLIHKFHRTSDITWLLQLPILQVVWVNSHTLYILGPVLMWTFTAAAIVGLMPVFKDRFDDRLDSRHVFQLAGISVAVTLACLINPYGVNGALFAFELFNQTMSDKSLNALIAELRSPFAVPGFSLLFISYCVAIVLSAIGFVMRWRKFSLGWLLLWGAFLYLSILAERNVALFGIVAGVTIMLNFSRPSVASSVGWAARIFCGVVLVVTIPAVISNYYYRSIDPHRKFGLSIAERRFPIRALEFVKVEGLPTPVIANLGESGYVLSREGPMSVYVDGRLEVYGPANAVSAIEKFSSANGLNEELERLKVFTLIANLDGDINLVQRLLQDPVWSPVYFDDSHIVFLRRAPSTQAAIERFKIDWSNAEPAAGPIPKELVNYVSPGIFPSVGDSSAERALGQLFAIAGNTTVAQAHLEEALRRWPNDPRACFQLGVIYRAQKREAEAERLFSRVTAGVADQPNSQILAAIIYERSGNMAAAADAWQKVVGFGDPGTAVYQHLAESAVASEKWEAAFTAYDALSRNSPNDVQILNNLGTVADKLNKRREALTALERSLQLKPGQPIVATQIGVIKAKNGDLNGARMAFEQALTADPSFAPARQYLDRLQGAQRAP